MTQSVKEGVEDVVYCYEHKSTECECEDKAVIGWYGEYQEK